MKLPCHLLFPELWQASVAGFTANLHRNGVLVACDLSAISGDLPQIGQRASVRIVLPANHSFSQKCMDCESVLVRVSQVGSGKWQFALRFQNVDFDEWAEEEPNLADLDGPSCRYVV